MRISDWSSDVCSSDLGFVWRLQGDSGNATDIQVADDPNFIVNMSVWKDLDSLFAYVYRSDHLQVMAQRRQWFEKPSGAFMALWWLPAGTLPSEIGRASWRESVCQYV